jgi:hypothetical protein
MPWALAGVPISLSIPTGGGPFIQKKKKMKTKNLKTRH